MTREFLPRLRVHLAALDCVRRDWQHEIDQAEQGRPPVLFGSDGSLSRTARAPNLAASIAADERWTKAQKHIHAAIKLLEPYPDHIGGIVEVLRMVVSMLPGQVPRSNKPRIVAEADAAGIDRDAIVKAAGIAGRAALKTMISRGRSKES